MENKKLSPHFKLFEFCVTSSGANAVQANRETASKPENLKKLTLIAEKILEPIRAVLIDPKNKFNCKFLTITSGVRTNSTKISNASVSSQHNWSEALDFVVDGTLENTYRLYNMIKDKLIPNLDHKYISQCILERKQRRDGSWSCWIHIGLLTERFKEQRKNAKRNYTNFPEFFISLDGYKYVIANPVNFKKYLNPIVDNEK